MCFLPYKGKNACARTKPDVVFFRMIGLYPLSSLYPDHKNFFGTTLHLSASLDVWQYGDVLRNCLFDGDELRKKTPELALTILSTYRDLEACMERTGYTPKDDAPLKVLVLDQRGNLRNASKVVVPDDPTLEKLFDQVREIAFLHPDLRSLPRLLKALRLPYLSQLLRAEPALSRPYVHVELTRRYRACLYLVLSMSARVLTKEEAAHTEAMATSLVVIADTRPRFGVRYTVGEAAWRSSASVTTLWMEEERCLLLGAEAARSVNRELISKITGVDCAIEFPDDLCKSLVEQYVKGVYPSVALPATLPLIGMQDLFNAPAGLRPAATSELRVLRTQRTIRTLDGVSMAPPPSTAHHAPLAASHGSTPPGTPLSALALSESGGTGGGGGGGTPTSHSGDLSVPAAEFSLVREEAYLSGLDARTGEQIIADMGRAVKQEAQAPAAASNGGSAASALVATELPQLELRNQMLIGRVAECYAYARLCALYPDAVGPQAWVSNNRRHFLNDGVAGSDALGYDITYTVGGVVRFLSRARQWLTYCADLLHRGEGSPRRELPLPALRKRVVRRAELRRSERSQIPDLARCTLSHTAAVLRDRPSAPKADRRVADVHGGGVVGHDGAAGDPLRSATDAHFHAHAYAHAHAHAHAPRHPHADADRHSGRGALEAESHVCSTVNARACRFASACVRTDHAAAHSVRPRNPGRCIARARRGRCIPCTRCERRHSVRQECPVHRDRGCACRRAEQARHCDEGGDEEGIRLCGSRVGGGRAEALGSERHLTGAYTQFTIFAFSRAASANALRRALSTLTHSPDDAQWPPACR